MPTFVYSRKKEYWRPLCRNQLRGETSLPSSAKALPCKVCVYPAEVPPIQGCWCTTATRPQGVDSALTFTLGGSLGSDSIGGTTLSNSGTRTFTNSGVTLDATMSPSDGAKSSIAVNTTLRDWIAASGTTFIAKNLLRYLPPDTTIPSCEWVALAGMHYVERVYHPTIVTSQNAQTFTYNDGLLRTGRFWNFDIAASHEVIKREIVLDNNDPGSVWLGRTGSALNYTKIRAWVPQVATGMNPIIGGPCQPVTCNNRCYPVVGHCWSNAAFLATDLGTPSSVKKWFSYWTYRTTVSGYYWVIKRHNSGTGVWLAWLMARDVTPWSQVTWTRPYPDIVAAYRLYAFRSENIANFITISNSDTSGWHYPASYHSAIPSFTQPGLFRHDTPGMVTTSSGGVFGGGFTGTARHPSWAVSIRSVDRSEAPNAGNGADRPLALYATENLGCTFSGTASMQKIADYRTPPNAAAFPIDAGPTSFPSSATLTF